METKKEWLELKYDGDVLSEETIKKLKAMEKRVIERITEPERELE